MIKQKGRIFMKKWRKMILGMAALGMSCSLYAGGTVTYADAEIVPMTEEEIQQKSNAMREWMEEYRAEYEAWQALSDYEQMERMSDEAIQKNGWDRLVKEDDAIYAMKGTCVKSIVPKEETVSEFAISSDIGITEIGPEALYSLNFEENGKLVLPEGIEKIGKASFWHLDNVVEIITAGSDKDLVSGLMLPPDLCIKSAAGSILVEAIPDMDGDGMITLKDAQIALRKALGLDKESTSSIKTVSTSESETMTLDKVRNILRSALKM